MGIFWERGTVGVLFFIGFWMSKQKSKVQTTLKKLIVFNGFANEENISIYTIYIYGLWPERNEIIKLKTKSYAESCTPAVPSVYFWRWHVPKSQLFRCCFGHQVLTQGPKWNFGWVGDSRNQEWLRQQKGEPHHERWEKPTETHLAMAFTHGHFRSTLRCKSFRRKPTHQDLRIETQQRTRKLQQL